MLKGEKIMKEWLGFFYGGVLIMRSTRYDDKIAKVAILKDGTIIAERMNYEEYRKIEVQVENQKENIKNKILSIFEIVIFYFIISIILYNILKDIGIIVGILNFVILGSYPLYDILKGINYAFYNKEKVQYAYLFKKLETCLIRQKEINEENLKNAGIRQSTLCISAVIFVAVISICSFLVRDVNIIVAILIQAASGFITVAIITAKKMKKKLAKLMLKLVYRKPTKEQMEMFLFAYRYVNEEENEF